MDLEVASSILVAHPVNRKMRKGSKQPMYSITNNVIVDNHNPKRKLRIGNKLKGGLFGSEVKFTVSSFEFKVDKLGKKCLFVILTYCMNRKDGSIVECKKQCNISYALRLKYGFKKKVEKWKKQKRKR